MLNPKNTLVALFVASVLATGSLAGCAGTSGSTSGGSAQAPAQQQTSEVNVNDQTHDSNDDESYASEEDFTDFSNLTSFSAKTTDGKTFTQDDLAKYDVTLINFWSLSCGACEDEMPQLSQLQKSLPSNVNIISVCVDEYATAKEVAQAAQEAGFEGTTLISGDGDLRTVVNQIEYVPTTIAVNSEGKVVGSPIIGEPANVAKEFTQLINDGLAKAGKDAINVAS